MNAKAIKIGHTDLDQIVIPIGQSAGYFSFCFDTRHPVEEHNFIQAIGQEEDKYALDNKEYGRYPIGYNK